IAFTFQTTGGAWHLSEAQRDKLRDEFPMVHVDSELTGIAAWTERNPDRMKPAGMWAWLRQRLGQKQSEHPLATAAYYGDGFTHTSLPTDPTPDQLDAILAG